MLFGGARLGKREFYKYSVTEPHLFKRAPYSLSQIYMFLYTLLGWGVTGSL